MPGSSARIFSESSSSNGLPFRRRPYDRFWRRRGKRATEPRGNNRRPQRSGAAGPSGKEEEKATMSDEAHEQQHNIYDLGLQADLAMWTRKPIERRRILQM